MRARAEHRSVATHRRLQRHRPGHRRAATARERPRSTAPRPRPAREHGPAPARPARARRRPGRRRSPTAASNDPSANGSSVAEPWTNEAPGWRREAISTIAAAISIPVASAPPRDRSGSGVSWTRSDIENAHAGSDARRVEQRLDRLSRDRAQELPIAVRSRPGSGPAHAPVDSRAAAHPSGGRGRLRRAGALAGTDHLTDHPT
jgi:hypothetical protein